MSSSRTQSAASHSQGSKTQRTTTRRPVDSPASHQQSPASHLPRIQGDLLPVQGRTPGAEHLDEVLKRVASAIAPVWPLRDYVAVNPYAGLASRHFLGARGMLRVVSDCEMLMPLEYYAQQLQQESFTWHDVDKARDELCRDGWQPPSLAAIRQVVEAAAGNPQAAESTAASRPRVEPLAGALDRLTGSQWMENITHEISKVCAAHYDQGQAAWRSPWQHLSLYHAWRQSAQVDRSIEVLGLRGFRQLVRQLPHAPEACLVWALSELQVPLPLWESLLLCHALALPGWSSWTRYLGEQAQHAGRFQDDFIGLLAIQLAYQVQLGRQQQFTIDWSSYATHHTSGTESASFQPSEPARVRYTLLRASELAYRRQLLQQLSTSTTQPTHSAQRPVAQVVCCIDVRSERLRRHVEAVHPGITTYGFAGFFGMPIEYHPLGSGGLDAAPRSQVPVLLRPQLCAHEGASCGDAAVEQAIVRQRVEQQQWRQAWSSLQSSVVSCFSFVETLGWTYALKLAKAVTGQALGKRESLPDNGPASSPTTGPTLRGWNAQGFCTSRQTDLAEGLLRNLGLTENFARLVVFCGHGSQTSNNPLQASLDCGACGGHSGEPNARLAALLLNQHYIRAGLAQRGIHIPDDTHFVAGLHNTTTDEVQLFDAHAVPGGHACEFEELQHTLNAAGQAAAQARLSSLGCETLPELKWRSGDWSEVRPEWGLADNAAFIAAPRHMTQTADLGGRAFLHSYDFRRDPQGRVLETILTAPLIVANWINLQYYASTVDPRHFGSGSKTVHNVVGRFGVLSGNSGDLKTGLPWQSVHSGQHYQHRPLRLQAVIAAPRAMIEPIIERHDHLSNLLSGGWMHLIAVEHGQSYAYTSDGTWQEIPTAAE